MNIERQDSKIVVELENEKINYSSEWFEEKPFLTNQGVEYMEEWKKDLIKNHGVDRNEL